MPELIIDDESTAGGKLDHVLMAERRGLVPRDYSVHPVGYLGELCPPMRAVDMPLIPRSDWSAIIKEMEETKSRLSDVRRIAGPNGTRYPSLGQNGQGFCWAYSTGAAITILRAKANLPYKRLSPHGVACKIKGFRDEGGWGALSLEFAIKNGYPTVEDWPEKSMSRQYDNPTTWANAEANKITEQWMDVEPPVYDRDLTFEQVMTCLLSRIPVVGDFNWWGHSVCLLDPVEVEPASFGVRIINSWTDNWGDKGESVLRGSKAIPDGATAPRFVTAV